MNGAPGDLPPDRDSCEERPCRCVHGYHLLDVLSGQDKANTASHRGVFAISGWRRDTGEYVGQQLLES